MTAPLSPDELSAGLMPRDVDGLKPEDRQQLLELARLRLAFENELLKDARDPDLGGLHEAAVSGHLSRWFIRKLAAVLAIQEKSSRGYVRIAVKARLLGVDAKILEVR